MHGVQFYPSVSDSRACLHFLFGLFLCFCDHPACGFPLWRDALQCRLVLSDMLWPGSARHIVSTPFGGIGCVLADCRSVFEQVARHNEVISADGRHAAAVIERAE